MDFEDSIKLGDETFSSLKDVSSYTGLLLRRLYDAGNRTITSESSEWYFFYDLILRHPEAEQKIGNGIRLFLIRMNKKRKPSLQIVRTNNTVTAISWKYCLNLKESNYNRNLYHAMREAIRYQLRRFRSRPNNICIICNKHVSYNESTSHHEPPTFKELKDEFIKNNPPPTTFDINASEHQAVFKVEDILYKRKWEAYHEQNCNLSIMHIDCHNKFHHIGRESNGN